MVVESKKKIVFIVEDDALLTQFYQTAFGKENAEVWVARDGQEAISFFEKHPPNVVLLDLMLPVVSGFEVLSQMRKNERWANVPVIIVSNLSRHEDVDKGEKLGAQGYLVKAEVELDDVVKRVKQYIS